MPRSRRHSGFDPLHEKIQLAQVMRAKLLSADDQDDAPSSGPASTRNVCRTSAATIYPRNQDDRVRREPTEVKRRRTSCRSRWSSRSPGNWAIDSSRSWKTTTSRCRLCKDRRTVTSRRSPRAHPRNDVSPEAGNCACIASTPPTIGNTLPSIQVRSVIRRDQHLVGGGLKTGSDPGSDGPLLVTNVGSARARGMSLLRSALGCELHLPLLIAVHR